MEVVCGDVELLDAGVGGVQEGLEDGEARHQQGFMFEAFRLLVFKFLDRKGSEGFEEELRTKLVLDKLLV